MFDDEYKPSWKSENDYSPVGIFTVLILSFIFAQIMWWLFPEQILWIGEVK